MIIVSQLGTLILNFNRLTALGISSLTDNSIAIKAYCSSSDEGVIIGRYKDVLRAKEVLQNIIRTYEECNKYGCGFVANEIYKMPKE